MQTTALREFSEETGLSISGNLVPLSPVRLASGKLVHAFAIEADLDLNPFNSNTFTMKWPPHSGRAASFPEVDHIGHFVYAEALIKITPYQRPLVEEAHHKLK